jgi:hypothetical protein
LSFFFTDLLDYKDLTHMFMNTTCSFLDKKTPGVNYQTLVLLSIHICFSKVHIVPCFFYTVWIRIKVL